MRLPGGEIYSLLTSVKFLEPVEVLVDEPVGTIGESIGGSEMTVEESLALMVGPGMKRMSISPVTAWAIDASIGPISVPFTLRSETVLFDAFCVFCQDSILMIVRV